jgi:hypothetical protein
MAAAAERIVRRSLRVDVRAELLDRRLEPGCELRCRFLRRFLAVDDDRRADDDSDAGQPDPM